jgi:signal transduction histidine kinase/CheY-like chemotaxis protein
MGQDSLEQQTFQIDPDFDPFIIEARSYKNQDKMVKAFEALKKAASWAEENENTKAAIITDHMFAQVYLEMRKPEQARPYFDKTYQLLDNMEKFPYGEALNHMLEAQLFLEGGFVQNAMQLVDLAKNSNNDRNLLNRATLLEGIILKRLSKTDSSITRFNALRGNKDPYEKNYLQAVAFLNLAEIYKDQGKLENAITNAENALDLSASNEFFREYKKSNELLSSLYESVGEYDKAVWSLRELMRIKDSTDAIQKFKLESEYSEQTQFTYLNKRINEQKQEIADLSESASRSEITAILTSAFLTIISLLAVSLYRNNQIKLKTNDLLQTKNKELQLARDAAVQAMEAKTNFLSTVSHELRTPLYAVTGLTHLLLEENPRKNQLEHLKALKFSGDYLLNFINDILQINKIDADKLEPLEVECNLKKVLNDVISGLQQSARDHKNEIILDYDPQIPTHLMSDPVKLSQVFMNLVGNALKFTREGEVVVIAKLLQRDGDHVNIYFEVRDNGIGIDKEQQATIFDSFEQGSIQINREYGGTGLGLTIVKSLLGLFGSKIQLESEPGRGSSFFFELRMKCKDELVDDIPFEISPRDYQYAGLHLLVVEDNKINQVITKKMLSKKEITCDIASNGTEAVELAGSNTYDGILMDIHMPGISGVEATEQIRQFDQETPIIALTAISLDDSLETFFAAGCNDVVTKPFKPEVFYEKIGENIIEPKMRKSYT